MTAANTQLLHILTELWRSRADASVVIAGGRIRRVVHVVRGELVRMDSDVHTERLGVQLVADWLLDARRVEDLVAAAKEAKLSLGEHLVGKGLITPQTMSAAVEKQALQRFDRALTMTGQVSVTALVPGRIVVRRPLGPEIIRAFRERLPVATASALVSQLMPRSDRLVDQFLSEGALGLTGAELRYFRQLSSGQGAAAVLDRAQDYNQALRLIGALVGMGAVGGEEVDLTGELRIIG